MDRAMSWGCSDAEGALTAGLISPRAGVGVCPRCFDITAGRDGGCPACARNGDQLTAIAPISYSVGGERLHRDIAAYKRLADPSVPAAAERIAGLLAHFLRAHERCLATRAGVSRFDLVTTVPSGSANRSRDEHHPLRRIVAAIEPTAARHERLLLPGPHAGAGREYDARRYHATRDLSALRILLIDDMWTTGASAQSAAAALRAAGATVVAAAVVGRHLNRGWPQNDLCLRRLRGNFSWGACPLCAGLSHQAAA